MSKSNRKPATTRLTIEQMKEIVGAANLLEGYRTELAQLQEKLATGDVDWLALPPFMEGLNRIFTRLHDGRNAAPAPQQKPAATKSVRKARKRARKAPTPPSPPVDAPEAPKEPKRPIPEARPSNLKFTVGEMTGTLAELSTHYKQDYNLVYHNLHRLSWSIEQALGLEKPPSDKKVNGALPNVRANPE